MPKPALDDIDREIIRRLSTDARMSNRAIADALAVTEGTIRARLKRLREAKLIRFTALTNLSRVGPMQIVFIRIRAEIARIREIAEALTADPAVKCVIVTTGDYPILAMSLMSDLRHDLEGLVTGLHTLSGVLAVETSTVTDAIKYNVKTAKILIPQTESVEDENGGDTGEEDSAA
jgi:DNA-binding Lrp family transcriptional regulator